MMRHQWIGQLSVVVLHGKYRAKYIRQGSACITLKVEKVEAISANKQMKYVRHLVQRRAGRRGSFQGGCPSRVIRTPTLAVRRPRHPHFALVGQLGVGFDD